MKKQLSTLVALLALYSAGAPAVLTIEVTEGVKGGIPIAVVPFESAQAGNPPHLVSDIVEADLVRSGRFDALPREDFLSRPSTFPEVQFKDWRLLKAEYLTVGKVRSIGPGQYDVQYELVDVFRGQQLIGYRYQVSEDLLRKAAHQIADQIYEKLLGQPGAFDTRIAYVTVEASGGSNEYLLQIADSDGYGARTALRSTQPILSPAWSPDGSHLAYVSFEGRNSSIYVQRVADGQRQRVAGFQGLNSAPAWSPDGRRLAVTLSKDGSPDIYVMNADGSNLQRLTRSPAIETEPAWSPDGRHLVFTSDRGGRPQIYRMNASGGAEERLTLQGKYNARASYAPDGRSLVLVTDQGSGYQIGLLDLRTRAIEILTDSRLDESPTFAPNGSMILYATQLGGRGVLAAVSSDGRVRQQLRFQEGTVREPAWSPFDRKL